MQWTETIYYHDLMFTLDCMDQFHVNAGVFEYPFEDLLESGIGYHRLLMDKDSLLRFVNQTLDNLEENVIYRLYDSLLCSYIVLKLPNTTPNAIFIVGPFLRERIEPAKILDIINILNFPSSIKEDLGSYYDVLPIIPSDDYIFAVLRPLGKSIWGNYENFSVKDARDFSSVLVDVNPNFNYDFDPTTSSMKIEILKQRYDLENEILSAISKGHTHQAELALNRFVASTNTEIRNHDPLRNIKNYLIIFNTLFRKAAERGYVHPLQIDRLSTQVALKIESFTNVEVAMAYAREMVRKYAMMVRNQSLKEYSDLIRQALTFISSDLTADLTLKSIATELNINSSYLSSLFKKELGVTLTEYVTQKRIEQAIFMLNSTGLPIADVAQYCGIPDIQYFSKIFKKQIGKTPSEYRKMLKETQ